MTMNKPSDFHIIMIKGRVAQENAMFYPQQISLTDQIHMDY